MGFLLEAVVIAVVLSGLKEVRDALYTGPRQIDVVGALLSVVGMGGVVLGILVWQEGGEAVGALMAIGAIALAGLAYWLVRRHRDEKPALLDPDLFRVPNFRIGITQQMLQQITLGGAMIALPIFLQMTLEYDAMQAGLSIAPLSLSMFGVAILAGRKAGTRRPSTIVQWGFALCLVGMVAIIPIVPRADSGWALLIPLDGRGIRARPARVAAQQLHAGSHLGGADQRGRRRELRGRFVRAVVRAGHGRWPHAGRAVAGLHRHDRGQRR